MAKQHKRRWAMQPAARFEFGGLPRSTQTLGYPCAIRREGAAMELATFSLSLAVKELAASQTFYAKPGLQVIAGDAANGSAGCVPRASSP
jgi:hypothetical protein